MAERERYQPKHGGRKKALRRRRIISVTLAILILVAVIALVVKIVKGGASKKEVEDPTTPAVTEEVTLGPNDVVSTAKVLSSGDVLIHKLLLDASASGDGYSFDKHFRAVKDEISAADYAIANLEVTLGEAPYSCYPTFKSPDSTASAIKNAGFNGVVMANNHCYDSGFDGVKRTVSVVDDLGLDHTGTRNDLSQKKYMVVDVNGIKIGIVNYAEETVSTSGRKALNGIK